eukprot:TRINITY_DN18198_c0_g1_i1.p2 TRINITY_DN18198_c0_g1~~TRINITY_DN18198_c0_g1_i1.p2  ORF type:complete len:123 (-),score=6.20 TRINITY_DN18198_c0_g1_i1:563-931(-)
MHVKRINNRLAITRMAYKLRGEGGLQSCATPTSQRCEPAHHHVLRAHEGLLLTQGISQAGRRNASRGRANTEMNRRPRPINPARCRGSLWESAHYMRTSMSLLPAHFLAKHRISMDAAFDVA